LGERREGRGEGGRREELLSLLNSFRCWNTIDTDFSVPDEVVLYLCV
jgi:hypothetical protein